MAQNRLVSFIKTPLFLAKEYLHRKPDASFRHDFVDEPRKTEAAALSETMRKDGIVMLPGYFKGAQLQSLQESFEKVVEGKVCTAGNPACFVTTDYFRDDPVFLNAALDSFLLEIVAGYYQKLSPSDVPVPCACFHTKPSGMAPSSGIMMPVVVRCTSCFYSHL
jgi:hypothetical protein